MYLKKKHKERGYATVQLNSGVGFSTAFGDELVGGNIGKNTQYTLATGRECLYHREPIRFDSCMVPQESYSTPNIF